MKKIINKKLYNTETAERVGTWDNNYPCNDFHFMSEELYQKKTGEFFLYGYGGAMSRYAESCGNNSWGSGEDIIPLSYDKAEDWAEEHLSADDFMKIFGEVSENDTDRITISVSMSVKEAESIKKLAHKQGMSVSAFIVAQCLK